MRLWIYIGNDRNADWSFLSTPSRPAQRRIYGEELAVSFHIELQSTLHCAGTSESKHQVNLCLFCSAPPQPQPIISSDLPSSQQNIRS
mmetsp:Transcript_2746/g.4702  ORF Transcript_2746/g.4702 Transcript_2746/m.4702 type:complete len:88 (+) Transcript_2746:897-1160(+)